MRSKLKLNLDQLAVDSFDTSEAATPKGTVFGEQCTCYTNCTCPGCPTCDHTCDASCNGTCAGQYTCDASCNGTCDWTCDYWQCNGTINDATCQNYGTCHWNSPCQQVP
jgi:hypothetical protein